jgi:hypothetical protein
MTVIGTCKLCLQNDVVLQDSHFLSKGIYKILRDEGARNKDPFLITKAAIVQTSRQLKRHLLCGPCEIRLNKGGENWVLRHCLQNDGRFLLAEKLAYAKPVMSAPENSTRIYSAALVPGIDVAQISYFAASIFWRGSIYPWNDDGSIPVQLGPFQERFRRYLMGEEPFPKHACLWVAVREGKGIDRLTHVPMGARIGELHAYKFPMPGLAFTLLVSRNVPAKNRSICFDCGPGNPIIVTPVLEGWLTQQAARAVQGAKNASSIRRGR